MENLNINKILNREQIVQKIKQILISFQENKNDISLKEEYIFMVILDVEKLNLF